MPTTKSARRLGLRLLPAGPLVLIAVAISAAELKPAVPQPDVPKKAARPSASLKDSAAVAAAVDKLILDSLVESGAEPAPKCSDEDFLRRISFDIAGTSPTAQEATLFALEPDPDKRNKTIDRLLAGESYGRNWAAYWRDVIFPRATQARAAGVQGVFETWMAAELNENRGWDKIATAMITATGNVQERGDTALIFAQSGDAADVAAEASRIFLGIQIQCANCHDHPTDKWKRQQFHQLAAFFPRIALRREKGDVRTYIVASMDDGPSGKGRQGALLEEPERMIAMLDRNRDKKLSKAEVERTPRLAKLFDKLLENGDSNKDGALSRDELRNMPAPPGMKRATSEYYMPDLNNPSSRGVKVEPAFFVNGKKARAGLDDADRRGTLAELMTAKSNPWFARSLVNRLWNELMGEGFVMPVDDMGPQRTARMPEALDLLADAFAANNYDAKWLLRTMARTAAYSRQIRPKDLSTETPVVFAANSPKRLRSDQLFNAIANVLGIEGVETAAKEPANYGKRAPRSAKAQFDALFAYDPSTPQEDLTGNVPQALFMMNSRLVNGLGGAKGNTRLARILDEYSDDKPAIREVYVLALTRDPSAKEEQLCLHYVKQSGNRREGFEDVLWSLMNSSEFLSKR